MTEATILADILRRELPPGVPWAAARAQALASDRGGWTRGGITVLSLGQFYGWNRAATREELDALSEAEALTFYRQRHVRAFDGYPDPLRLLLIDFGVTSSHLTVFKALQQALRTLGLYTGAIDGVAGSKTRTAVAACVAHRELFLLTLENRARYYAALSCDDAVRAFLRAHPETQLHNLAGWQNRCWEFTRYAPAD